MYEAVHFPLVTYVLNVFQCTTDPLSGISYISDHPYLTCDSISPAGKVIPLLLYPIGLVGFFICLAIYLHYAPNDVKESEAILQSFAFFYVRFKPDRVVAGVFFMLEYLGLSLIVGLMQPNNDVFPTLIIMLLIVDFFFLAVYQPYLQPRYNKVRAVNDMVALLLFCNNLIYSSTSQFPVRTATPVTVYCGLNIGMVIFFGFNLYRLFKFHRGEMLPVHHGGSVSMDSHGRPDQRKHLELADLKQRKHTNIDPPSTSHSREVPVNGGHHGYAPVSTNSPQPELSVERSDRSLPIISEHDHHNESSTNGSDKHQINPLVFTENPLADNNSVTLQEPPSPSPLVD